MSNNESLLYLQTPFGIEQNEALIERVVHTLETGKVSALLCHNMALIEHFIEKYELKEATTYLLPYSIDEEVNAPIDGNSLQDGYHFFNVNPKDIKQVSKSNKDMTLGAGPTASTDDALDWAESGVDYVAFSASQTEALKWWMANVTIPCVAWGAQDLNHVKELLNLEADFILPAPVFWQKDATDLNRLLELF